ISMGALYPPFSVYHFFCIFVSGLTSCPLATHLVNNQTNISIRLNEGMEGMGAVHILTNSSIRMVMQAQKQ
ncbi:MAG: hypothetical protein M3Y81_21035, partial [Chloroflexota bacterium]|nr:hypothetical protein [Chloroflexota bacterium]